MDNNTSCSIVLYKDNIDQLSKVIISSLNADVISALYLIDNSPNNELKNVSSDNRVIYIHNPSNPGFGAAHNIAINLAIKAGSNYHFIINPDIYFEIDVIKSMVNYMEANKDVGMLMPEILYPNGSIQHLPKLLPNPFWILKRKFTFLSFSYRKFIGKYELRHAPSKMVYNSPILSGCFSLLNLDAIKKVGTYDDSYFMYFEDFDLSRRMHQKYKTLYFPTVSVYHGYESGANKNFKLFKIFIISAITYFNKWGWFFDKKRKEINYRTLEQFKQK